MAHMKIHQVSRDTFIFNDNAKIKYQQTEIIKHAVKCVKFGCLI